MTIQTQVISARNAIRTARFLDASSFNARSLAIICAAVCATSAVMAQMQAPAKPAPMMSAKAEEAFKRADTNNDGKLSKDEAAALPAVAELFDKADTDKDGFLSKAEFAELAKE